MAILQGFVAALISASVQAPPSPIVTVPVPPPIITPNLPPPFVSAGRYNRPTVTISVRATSGDNVLLNDRFRVGTSAASFMLNRSEAGPANCTASETYTGVRSSLMFSLRPDGPTSGDRYRLSLNWSRPKGPCEGDGSRGVSLEQLVVLKSGDPVVIEGDGGVKVELRRH